MNASIVDKIRANHEANPILGALETSTQAKKVEQLETDLNCTFSDGYREFIEKCGSGLVGNLPIWGSVPTDMYPNNGTVLEVTKSFREQKWPICDSGPVVSTDLGGNPIVETPSGKIICHDHDFGGPFEEADNFISFLEKLMER